MLVITKHASIEIRAKTQRYDLNACSSRTLAWGQRGPTPPPQTCFRNHIFSEKWARRASNYLRQGLSEVFTTPRSGYNVNILRHLERNDGHGSDPIVAAFFERIVFCWNGYMLCCNTSISRHVCIQCKSLLSTIHSYVP